MADEITALIEQLGFERADVAGYSQGGGVALADAHSVHIDTPLEKSGALMGRGGLKNVA